MRIARLGFIGGLCLLLLLLTACRRTPSEPPPNAADVLAEIRALGDVDSLVRRLNELPEGADILVDEKLAALVPPKLRAHPYAWPVGVKAGFYLPDKRPNPATVNYLLGEKNLELAALRFADPDLWTPLLTVEMKIRPRLLLLQRSRPAAEQLAAPLTPKAFAAQLPETAELNFETTDDQTGQPVRRRVFIDRFEVTNEQYAYFLDELAPSFDEVIVYYGIKDPTSKIVYVDGHYRVYQGTGRYPVFNVSYYGARAFCGHYGKRLVRYQEWKHASGFTRDQRQFPWGHERDFTRRGNFQGDQDGHLLWAPVDAFPEGQSPFGIYNMAGNIWEWIEDGNNLVGGSWDYPPEPYGQVSLPSVNTPLARNQHDGFRCARDP